MYVYTKAYLPSSPAHGRIGGRSMFSHSQSGLGGLDLQLDRSEGQGSDEQKQEPSEQGYLPEDVFI